MQITIEATKLQQRLSKIEQGLDVEIPKLVKESASVISTDLRARFKQEVAPSGKRWQRLSSFTLKEKREAGYGDKPILVRKGNLRNSIQPRRITNLAYYVGSFGVDYADKHQNGDRSENLPARPFIGLPNESIRRIRGLVDKLTRKLIHD